MRELWAQDPVARPTFAREVVPRLERMVRKAEEDNGGALEADLMDFLGVV